MEAEIRHISPEEYHSSKALSNSGIAKLLDCPARFKAWLDGDMDEQTEAMLIGSAFHCMALEPEKFSSRYHVMEKSGATKVGKDEKSSAEAAGQIILARRQYEEIVPLMNGLRRHKMIGRLLADPSSNKEVSIFWEEALDGEIIPCKARLDLVALVRPLGHLIVDLKSMSDAAPVRLPKIINDRGYHRQAWWYMRALFRAGLEPRAFLLAAVEKKPPYLAALIGVEEPAIEKGGRECLEAMRLYADCSRTGIWPGYPEEIIKIDLPEWIYRKEQSNETDGQFAH